MKDFIGALINKNWAYIDHIAPFCSLLNIPLYITDKEMEKAICTFYPELNYTLCSAQNYAEQILKKDSYVITNLPKPWLDTMFFLEERVLQKKLKTIWLPHGNSDKENLGGLVKESQLLIYGKQMFDRLQNQGVFHKKISLGNFRYSYFCKHKTFYQKLCQKYLKLQKKQKTLLYAPSWEETSVEKNLFYILENLPKRYNLFVKCHPNLWEKSFFYRAKMQYAEKSNILFVDKFPTIYPLLNKTDIYIGDLSSIGYDFLTFNKPLFFLTNTKTSLQACGKHISLENLFPSLEMRDTLHKMRKKMYRYTFNTESLFTSQ